MHISTIPENSGMSVDFSHCLDGVVDMSAVKLKKASQSAFYIIMHVRRSHICIIVNTPTYICMYKRVRVSFMSYLAHYSTGL